MALPNLSKGKATSIREESCEIIFAFAGAYRELYIPDNSGSNLLEIFTCGKERIEREKKINNPVKVQINIFIK
ncbi:MAG: hypothetical protein OEV55_03550 [candidate division Zixibacteria bacterium]|nr:hypothetical protein [candidate division Zixibacteria bacterium]